MGKRDILMCMPGPSEPGWMLRDKVMCWEAATWKDLAGMGSIWLTRTKSSMLRTLRQALVLLVHSWIY